MTLFSKPLIGQDKALLEAHARLQAAFAALDYEFEWAIVDLQHAFDEEAVNLRTAFVAEVASAMPK